MPRPSVDVPRDARVMGEEIFGPVAPITTFREDDEDIHMAIERRLT